MARLFSIPRCLGGGFVESGNKRVTVFEDQDVKFRSERLTCELRTNIFYSTIFPGPGPAVIGIQLELERALCATSVTSPST